MNIKVKMRTTEIEITELKTRVKFWQSLALIFGFGFFALLLLLMVVIE